jgi:DNA primase large subunit
MSMMFRDTSLGFAEKQKESMIRDQQKKIDKELKRRQAFIDSKQKSALKEFYRKEYRVKVTQKVMESLTVPEFEEYLKRRHYELKYKKALRVVKSYLLTHIYKRRYQKRQKKRDEAATLIQRWYRKEWTTI